MVKRFLLFLLSETALLSRRFPSNIVCVCATKGAHSYSNDIVSQSVSFLHFSFPVLLVGGPAKVLWLSSPDNINTVVGYLAQDVMSVSVCYFFLSYSYFLFLYFVFPCVFQELYEGERGRDKIVIFL